MIELSTLLDLISDRQLQEYVAWLEAHPDSNEEESIAYLMDILNNSQVDILLEKDFKATPYSSWYGACIHPDGRCFESTMSDCRVLGGRFQGPGTSCGGHYTKPLMYQSEDEDDWYDDSYYDPQMATEQAYEGWSEDWVSGFSDDVLNIYIALTGDEDSTQQDADQWYDSLTEEEREKILSDTDNSRLNNAIDDIMDNLLSSWDDQFLAERFTAPVGKVFHDPAAARDPRLKNDNPPSSVTQYLQKHPEVANLYDDDDASIMLKGIIIGCLIGALGTIFGNLASEMIMDKFKINPQFKWDQ
tara:strand:- start:4302 stop:5204 length:903 start_codon:yes stop_codon:yes gene_type:complete